MVRVSESSTRPANGVYNGVLGVVEICANSLTRAARFEGDNVKRLGVAVGRSLGLEVVDKSSLSLKGDST